MTATRRATTLLAGVAVAGALAAAAVAFGPSGGAAPAPRLVRVTAGHEVATGFVTGRGRVTTVAHVLEGGPADEGPSAAGRRARVVSTDRRDDVAVLAVPGVAGATPRRVAARARGAVTVRVLRSGRARSLRATVRRAITARLRPPEGPVLVRPALELAARVEPGDSGAPVLDGDGRLVGVLFAQATGSAAVAYAVDARVLRP